MSARRKPSPPRSTTLAIRDVILKALEVQPVGRTAAQVADIYNANRRTLPELTAGETLAHLQAMPDRVSAATVGAALWIAYQNDATYVVETAPPTNVQRIIRREGETTTVALAGLVTHEQANLIARVLNMEARRKAHHEALLLTRSTVVDGLFEAVAPVMKQIIIRHDRGELAVRVHRAIEILGATELKGAEARSLYPRHVAVYRSNTANSWKAVTETSVVRLYNMFDATHNVRGDIELIFEQVIKLWEVNAQYTPDGDQELPLADAHRLIHRLM